MPQIPNPNQSKPFDRVIKDQNGNDLYGIRNEHTRDEEIVHIPTQRSNQQYWQPEMVLNPEGCEHAFVITNMGKREVECTKCHVETTFHAGVNYIEEDGKAFIQLHTGRFPVIPL